MDALLREACWVRSLALQLARDQATADDAAQATMALALERRPDVDASLRPWLARVVSRLSRRSVREEARRISRERVAAARSAEAESSDDLLERFELQQALAARVRALPEPYRGVILRRFYDGQTAAEIARETGASPATVRSQIARGVERLRREFPMDAGVNGLHSGGALALFLTAAGSGGELLTLRGAEMMAMKTTSKVGLATLMVAATFFATRGFLTSTQDAVRSSKDDTVLARPGPGETSIEALADVEVRSERGRKVELAQPEVESAEATDLVPDSARAVSVVWARIVDENDLPLEGAELRSIYMDGRPRGGASFARADANGELAIEIEDEFMRAYETEVFAMGFQATAPMRETVFVVSTPRWHGETDLGDIALEPGGAIRGRLVDESGRAVSGGVVYAADPVLVEEEDRVRLAGPDRGQRRPRAESDTSGSFLFPGLRTGAHRLYAGADGRLWTVTDPVEVAAGGTKDAGALVLEPIPAEELITGTVRRPDGTPAAGAAVAYEMRAGQREGSVRADESGRFTFHPAGPGEVEFVARDPGGEFGMSAVAVASRGTEELVLELGPRREIVLTIVDDEGEPVAAASVMPFFTDRDAYADGGRPIPGEDWTHSDDAGIARVEVPQQEFTLSASHRGYAAERHGPFHPEDAPEEVRVVLVRDPILEGRVLAYGEPVEGATVKVAQRIENFIPLESGFPMRFFMGQSDRVETDAEGRFECSVDPDWTDVSILAFHDEFATGETQSTLEAGEGADGIVIQMTRGGTVHGAVLPPPGMDVEELYVAASRGDGHPVWTRANPDGTYSLDRLSPGPWRVEGRLTEPVAEVLSVANDPEDKEFRWNAEVVDGGETILDVDMRERGHIALHGRFLVDGEPARGWSVTAEREADEHTGRGIPSTEIDGSGEFVLEVPAGTCTLTLTGHLDGEMRAKVVRILELGGTRVDWEESLETGPVDESVDIAEGPARICRGNSYGKTYELTFLGANSEGRVVGRAFTGESHIQTERQLSIGAIWANLRPLEIRPD